MKAIFFDLDNTLYDSRQYLFGAFKEVSFYLSNRFKLPWQKIYKKLINIWKVKTSAYPYLFNDILKELEIKDGKLVEEIVNIFNDYRGNLVVYADVVSTLEECKKLGYKLGIITDGNTLRQRRKIELLGIKKFFQAIIYTEEIIPKPSKEPFLIGLKELKVNPQVSFYVADNPMIDFEGAKMVGMKTVRIKRGEFANLSQNKYIDFEIDRLKHLLKIIK